MNHLDRRLVDLYKNRQHHRSNKVILGPFSMVIGHHRTKNWLKKVFHSAYFDSESLLYDELKSAHKELGFSKTHIFELFSESVVEPELVTFHEIGNVGDEVEVNTFLWVFADHVEEKFPETLGDCLPKMLRFEPTFDVFQDLEVLFFVFGLKEQPHLVR